MNYSIGRTQLPASTSAIAEFCKKWRIEQFALFGSVLRSDFQPESDVDVLVTFAPEVRTSLSERMRMNAELRELFQRPVDLVERRAIEADPNYIRKGSILGSAKVIYGS